MAIKLAGSIARWGRKLAWLYLIGLPFFLWGIATAHWHVFPYGVLQPAYAEIRDFATFEEGDGRTLTEMVSLAHQEYFTEYEFGGLKYRDPEFRDSGYLLISQFNKEQDQVVISLFSLAENRVLHTWVPDIKAIFAKSPQHTTRVNTWMAYRAQHPILLPGGDLVFHSGEGPLVRIDPQGKPVWVIDRTFHHAIELDGQGRLVVGLFPTPWQDGVESPTYNDGFAFVSQDGEVLEEHSVLKPLIEQGYDYLVFGVGRYETDRLHLNDAQPILEKTPDAEVGDIALSLRNISTVAMYRPATRKLLWVKTGPWLNQHDINPLGAGRYSIMGNDTVRNGNVEKLPGGGDSPFMYGLRGYSDVYIYDAINQVVTQPFTQVMAREKIETLTSGRAKILKNGDACVEQSTHSRILRISPDGVRWEYVHRISDNTVGAIHWSRYLTQEEVNLSWLENTAWK